MMSLSRGVIFISLLLLVFSGQAVGSPEIEKIDINSAPPEDLVKIIHIGEVRAEELIFLRPFSSLDDLIRIKGIGETKLKDIKEQDLAWISEQPRVEPDKSIIEDQPRQTYPSGIVINEILPSPEGADAEKEWVELFNQNKFETNLSSWQITDLVGQTQGYTLPEGSIIEPEGFFLLFRPTTKITLNNSGDELRLIRPDDKIEDSLAYENAPNGESFNRTPSGWTWSSHLTPGGTNSISLSEKSEEIETPEEAGKIDINAAPLKDLVKIVHIGEVRALELISSRPFYSLDNLTRINGIGDKALEDIKKQGLAWTDPKLESPKIDEKTDSPEKKTAAITGSLKSFDLAQDKGTPKSLSVYSIALAVAIFSGVIIFILKKKLKNTRE